MEVVANPYQIVLANFAMHLLEGIKLIADGWDGLRQVQLANAIYVSGWEERRVTLPVEEAHYLDGLRSRQQAERGKM